MARITENLLLVVGLDDSEFKYRYRTIEKELDAISNVSLKMNLRRFNAQIETVRKRFKSLEASASIMPTFDYSQFNQGVSVAKEALNDFKNQVKLLNANLRVSLGLLSQIDTGKFDKKQNNNNNQNQFQSLERLSATVQAINNSVQSIDLSQLTPPKLSKTQVTNYQNFANSLKSLASGIKKLSDIDSGAIGQLTTELNNLPDNKTIRVNFDSISQAIIGSQTLQTRLNLLEAKNYQINTSFNLEGIERAVDYLTELEANLATTSNRLTSLLSDFSNIQNRFTSQLQDTANVQLDLDGFEQQVRSITSIINSLDTSGSPLSFVDFDPFETIKAIERIYDSVLILNTLWKELSNIEPQLKLNNDSALIKITEVLREWSLIEEPLRLNLLYGDLSQFVTSLNSVVENLQSISNTSFQLVSAEELGIREIDTFINRIENINRAINAVSDLQVNANITGIENIERQLIDLVTALNVVRARFNEGFLGEILPNDKIIGTIQSLKFIKASIRDLSSISPNLDIDVSSINNRLNGIQDHLEDVLIDVSQLQSRLNSLSVGAIDAENIERLRQTFADLGSDFYSISTAFETAKTIVADDVRDMITRLRTFQEAINSLEGRTVSISISDLTESYSRLEEVETKLQRLESLVEGLVNSVPEFRLDTSNLENNQLPAIRNQIQQLTDTTPLLNLDLRRAVRQIEALILKIGKIGPDINLDVSLDKKALNTLRTEARKALYKSFSRDGFELKLNKKYFNSQLVGIRRQLRRLAGTNPQFQADLSVIENQITAVETRINNISGQVSLELGNLTELESSLQNLQLILSQTTFDDAGLTQQITNNISAVNSFITVFNTLKNSANNDIIDITNALNGLQSKINNMKGKQIRVYITDLNPSLERLEQVRLRLVDLAQNPITLAVNDTALNDLIAQIENTIAAKRDLDDVVNQSLDLETNFRLDTSYFTNTQIPEIRQQIQDVQPRLSLDLRQVVQQIKAICTLYHRVLENCEPEISVKIDDGEVNRQKTELENKLAQATSNLTARIFIDKKALNSELVAIRKKIWNLSNIRAPLSLSLENINAQLEALQNRINTPINFVVGIDNYQTIIDNISDINTALNQLQTIEKLVAEDAFTSVSLDKFLTTFNALQTTVRTEINGAISELDRLQTAINNVKGKQIPVYLTDLNASLDRLQNLQEQVQFFRDNLEQNYGSAYFNGLENQLNNLISLVTRLNADLRNLDTAFNINSLNDKINTIREAADITLEFKVDTTGFETSIRPEIERQIRSFEAIQPVLSFNLKKAIQQLDALKAVVIKRLSGLQPEIDLNITSDQTSLDNLETKLTTLTNNFNAFRNTINSLGSALESISSFQTSTLVDIQSRVEDLPNRVRDALNALNTEIQITLEDGVSANLRNIDLFGSFITDYERISTDFTNRLEALINRSIERLSRNVTNTNPTQAIQNEVIDIGDQKAILANVERYFNTYIAKDKARESTVAKKLEDVDRAIAFLQGSNSAEAQGLLEELRQLRRKITDRTGINNNNNAGDSLDSRDYGDIESRPQNTKQTAEERTSELKDYMREAINLKKPNKTEEETKQALQALGRFIRKSGGVEVEGFNKIRNYTLKGGAAGRVIPRDNEVEFRRDVFDRLQQGEITRESLKVVLHELRHTAQVLAMRHKQKFKYLTPKNEKEKSYTDWVDKTYKDPTINKLERDAEVYSERYVDEFARTMGIRFERIDPAQKFKEQLRGAEDSLRQSFSRRHEIMASGDAKTQAELRKSIEKTIDFIRSRRAKLDNIAAEESYDLSSALESRDRPSNEEREAIREERRARKYDPTPVEPGGFRRFQQEMRAREATADMPDNEARRRAAERQANQEEQINRRFRSQARRERDRIEAEREQRRRREQESTRRFSDLLSNISVDAIEAYSNELGNILRIGLDVVDFLVDAEDASAALQNFAMPASFLALAATTALIAVNGARAVSEMQRLERTLSALNVPDAGQILEDVPDLAIQTGLDLGEVSRRAASFVSAIQDTSLELEAPRIFRSVLGYGEILNVGSDELSRGLVALEQIAAKGRVSLEELNGQLSEAISGVSNIAATSLGITRAELFNLVQAGDLLAEDLLPALATSLENIRELESGSKIKSLNQEFRKLVQNINVLSAAATSKPVNALANALSYLNEKLRDFDDILPSIVAVLFQAVGLATLLLGVASAIKLGQFVATTKLFGIAISAMLPWIAAITAAIGTFTILVGIFNQFSSLKTGDLRIKFDQKAAQNTIDKINSIKRAVIELREATNDEPIALELAIDEFIREADIITKELVKLQAYWKFITKQPIAFFRIALGGAEGKREFKEQILRDGVKDFLEAEQKLREDTAKKLAQSSYELGVQISLQINDTELVDEVNSVVVQSREAIEKATALQAAGKNQQKQNIPFTEFRETPLIQNLLGDEAAVINSYEQLFDRLNSLITSESAKQREALGRVIPGGAAAFDASINSLENQLKILPPTSEAYRKVAETLDFLRILQARYNETIEKSTELNLGLAQALKEVESRESQAKTKTELASALEEQALLKRALSENILDNKQLEQLRTANKRAELMAQLQDAKSFYAEIEELQSKLSTKARNVIEIQFDKEAKDLTATEIDQLIATDSLGKSDVKYLEELKSRQKQLASIVGVQNELLALDLEAAQQQLKIQENNSKAQQDYNDSIADAYNKLDDAAKTLLDTYASLSNDLTKELIELKGELNQLQKENERRRNTLSRRQNFSEQGLDFSDSKIFAAIGEYEENLEKAAKEALDIQTEELSIEEEFRNGVKAINDAFDAYLSAFDEFQKELQEAALRLQEIRKENQPIPQVTPNETTAYDRSYAELVEQAEKSNYEQIEATKQQIKTQAKSDDKLSQIVAQFESIGVAVNALGNKALPKIELPPISLGDDVFLNIQNILLDIRELLANNSVVEGNSETPEELKTRIQRAKYEAYKQGQLNEVSAKYQQSEDPADKAYYRFLADVISGQKESYGESFKWVSENTFDQLNTTTQSLGQTLAQQEVPNVTPSNNKEIPTIPDKQALLDKQTEKKNIQQQLTQIKKEAQQLTLEEADQTLKEQSVEAVKEYQELIEDTLEELDNPDLDAITQARQDAENPFDSTIESLKERKTQVEMALKVITAEIAGIDKALAQELSQEARLTFETTKAALENSKTELESLGIEPAIDREQQRKQRAGDDAARLKEAEIRFNRRYDGREEELEILDSDPFTSQDTKDLIRLEQERMNQLKDLESDIQSQTVVYEEMGYSFVEARKMAEAEVARINQLKLEGIKREFDSFTNYAKKAVGDLGESLARIDLVGILRGDTTLDDELLNILGNVGESLADWAGGKLNEAIGEDLFGLLEQNPAPFTPPIAPPIVPPIAPMQLNNPLNEQINPLDIYGEPDEYTRVADMLAQAVTLSNQEVANRTISAETQAVEQILRNRGQLKSISQNQQNLTSPIGGTQGNLPGYLGGASMLVGGIASGNKSSMLSGAGTIIGTIAGGGIGGIIGGSIGTLLGSIFYKGGEATLGKDMPLNKALAKEKAMSGKQPMLGVLHEGEQVLSTLNNDAQTYQRAKQNGMWESIKSGLFYQGGTVGGNGITSSTNFDNSRKSESKVINNVTNTINLKGAANDVLKYSYDQLQARQSRLL